MQFAYQFPERCDRLVLVSSGGLGREVHLLLRAAALPGRRLGAPGARRRRASRASAAAWPRRSGSAASRPTATSPCSRAASRRSNSKGSRRGVPAHRALRDRPLRPARQRARPPPPGRGPADADRVGRARLDHPRRPTAARRTRRCRRAASRCSRAPATCPTTTTPSASPTILADFCASTEPARLTTDHWRPLLWTARQVLLERLHRREQVAQRGHPLQHLIGRERQRLVRVGQVGDLVPGQRRRDRRPLHRPQRVDVDRRLVAVVLAPVHEHLAGALGLAHVRDDALRVAALEQLRQPARERARVRVGDPRRVQRQVDLHALRARRLRERLQPEMVERQLAAPARPARTPRSSPAGPGSRSKAIIVG